MDDLEASLKDEKSFNSLVGEVRNAYLDKIEPVEKISEIFSCGIDAIGHLCRGLRESRRSITWGVQRPCWRVQ